MPEKKEETPESVKKNSPNLILVIVGVLLVQALLAFGLVMLTAPKSTQDDILVDENSATQNEKAFALSVNEVVIPIKTEVVVNISGTNGMRFLKAVITLAYDGSLKKNADLELALPNLQSPLRSRAREYLSALTLGDVQDRNAQQQIRTDLLRELNEIMPAQVGEFSNVYLEEFIIQ